MWNNLPLDLLSNIFSFLSPDSLARARSSCKYWHTCANSYPLTQKSSSSSSWFLALPIRNHRLCCYAHNPELEIWHELSLEFLPVKAIRPVTTIGSLLLLRLTNCTRLQQLALCNPFSKQFRCLPRFCISRTNPAVGVTVLDSIQFQSNNGFNERFSGQQYNQSQNNKVPQFRVYVAGGMSEAVQCGATYEPSVEMYDSQLDTWHVVGPIPMEFAVRLTVWTPNENVCIGETLYWITSARAYSVMGFNFVTHAWKELSVPMAEKLEFATLVPRNGALGLVGGTCGGSACVWELNERDTWRLVDEVPVELGMKLLLGKRNWESVKCVGNGDVICLYRELGSGMVICRRVRESWEWVWVNGCGYVKGKQVQNCPIRGTLVHPTLASFLGF